MFKSFFALEAKPITELPTVDEFNPLNDFIRSSKRKLNMGFNTEETLLTKHILAVQAMVKHHDA
jgi:hypothetical protein